MKILYSSPDDLVLVGTERELAALRETIETAGPLDIRIPARPVDPEAYSQALDQLVVEATQGPTRVEVDGNVIRISGSLQNLKRFSAFLQPVAGFHSHFEWHADNPFVAEDSIPLVIQCEPTQSRTT